MAWIILFIASYILFFLLVDYKALKTNIWCGLLAIVLQMLTDSQAISHQYYRINDPVLHIWGSSLFFVLGPVLVIGILLAQYHPVKSSHIIMNVIVLTALYTLQEVLLLMTGALTYTNWGLVLSAQINFLSLLCLSWFSFFALKKGGYGH